MTRTVLLIEETRPLTEWDVVCVNSVIRVTRTTAKPKIHLGFRIERPKSLTDKSDLDRAGIAMVTTRREKKVARSHRRIDSRRVWANASKGSRRIVDKRQKTERGPLAEATGTAFPNKVKKSEDRVEEACRGSLIARLHCT